MQKFCDSGDDGALITITGFDHEAFGAMLLVHEPYFDNYSPWIGDQDGSTFRKLRMPSVEPTFLKRPRLQGNFHHIDQFSALDK